MTPPTPADYIAADVFIGEYVNQCNGQLAPGLEWLREEYAQALLKEGRT